MTIFAVAVAVFVAIVGLLCLYCLFAINAIEDAFLDDILEDDNDQ